jgi:hypothetical protein
VLSNISQCIFRYDETVIATVCVENQLIKPQKEVVFLQAKVIEETNLSRIDTF